MLAKFLLLSAALVQAAFAASAGCNKAPGLTSGTKTITVNGKSRQYVLKVPDNYDQTRPYRVIFGLHWRGGSMTDVVNNQYYGLLPLAQNSAIFVSPNGFSNGWANNGGEDIAFIDALVKTIDQGLCVDEKLRFATGFSWGGGMSYSIACSRAKDFRAVAAIAGGLISGCAGGTDKIAYLGIHGVSDNVLPIAQGRSLRDTFLRNNGCQSKNAPEPAAGSRQVMKTSYTCSAGYPVTWVATDAGHVPDPRNAQNQNVAPGETWSFFSQFTGGGAPETPPTTTSAGPGPQPTSTSASTPAPSPTQGACAARWGQCGGSGFTGPKCCESGSTCTFSNDWYSQCL